MDSPLPFGRRHSLLGSWVRPLRNWAVLPKIVRLTGWARPHRGFHVPHERDATGVGASCTAGQRCSGVRVPRRHTRWSRLGVTHALSSSPQPPIAMTSSSFAASTEVHLRSPFPSFPRPACPGWFGLALGFTRLLSHASLPGGCGSGTDLNTDLDHGDSSRGHSLRATSCRKGRRRVYHAEEASGQSNWEGEMSADEGQWATTQAPVKPRGGGI